MDEQRAELARMLGACPCCGKFDCELTIQDKLRNKLSQRRMALQKCSEGSACRECTASCPEDHSTELNEIDELLISINQTDGTEKKRRKKTRKKKRMDTTKLEAAGNELWECGRINELGVGSRVQIDGIKSRPEMNGKFGTVEAYLPDRERYSVQVDGEKLALKLAVLTMVDMDTTQSISERCPQRLSALAATALNRHHCQHEHHCHDACAQRSLNSKLSKADEFLPLPDDEDEFWGTSVDKEVCAFEQTLHCTNNNCACRLKLTPVIKGKIVQMCKTMMKVRRSQECRQ